MKIEIGSEPHVQHFFKTLPKVAFHPACQNSIMKNDFNMTHLKYKCLNVKLRMLLAGHTVFMLIYCVRKVIQTAKQ